MDRNQENREEEIIKRLENKEEEPETEKNQDINKQEKEGQILEAKETEEEKKDKEKKITADLIINVMHHEQLIRLSPNENEDDEIQELLSKDSRIAVELEEDIYCTGFLIFMQKQNTQLFDKMVLKCTFTFIFQILLIGCLLNEYLEVQMIDG
jgi:hypothetical protein